MVDRKVVEEQFKRMTDGELLSFVNNESMKITPDAFYLLKIEYQIRNLDISAINEAEINRSLLGYNQQKAIETATAFEITATVWTYAMDQKAQGATNSNIYEGLIKKRIDPDYAYFIIDELENKAKSILEDTDTNIIVGYITIICGVVLIFLSSSETLPKATLFYGIAIILAGIIVLYRNTVTKSKFTKIIHNIKAEKEDELLEK